MKKAAHTKKGTSILSCIMVISLLMCSLYYLTKILEEKSSAMKYHDFFSQKEDFDVLFLGTSRVINGIFPMELWKDYGIVSYNLGGHQNELATSYWVMENALNHTTPEVVVVDCFCLSSNIKTSENFSFVHLSLDAFPLNLTKISAAKDLLNDPVIEERIAAGTIQGRGTEDRSIWGILWNFSVYHSRWNELRQVDFDLTGSLEKGAETRIGIEIPLTPDQVQSDEILQENTVGAEYIRKIIESCDSKGIDVLLIYLPSPTPYSTQIQEASAAQKIAEEYGVNYINFMESDTINYNTDCYDSTTHLNPSGARKVTDYLGQYIMDHYSVADQRTNSDYSEWQEDYQQYAEFKLSNLKNQQSLDDYLMLLADKNFKAVIEINNPDIWNSNYYCHLFENLGIDRGNSHSISVNSDSGSDLKITVFDKDTNTVLDSVTFQFEIIDDKVFIENVER